MNATIEVARSSPVAQRGDGLRKRLATAVAASYAGAPARRGVVVGADVPKLNGDVLAAALAVQVGLYLACLSVT